MISKILLVLLILLVIYLLYTQSAEKFAPYASILAPEIINTTAGFDAPNQFGEKNDPYQNTKDNSEIRLFNQINLTS